jgi:hypothetical protein
MLFLQSSELGLHANPSPAQASVLPLWLGGEWHTRWRERGWESPNSDEGTHIAVLYLYKFFVDKSKKKNRET